jgi:hypothetical protein
MVLVKRCPSAEMLTRSCIHESEQSAGKTEILTACDLGFSLSFHLNDPLIPPIHLDDAVRRYRAFEGMTVG